MATIKPFERDDREYTRIHNFVFDILMPLLSPTAFKVLAYIVRQTKGWCLESEALSYTDIMKGTGIKSATTVAAGIAALLELNCITVTYGATWDKNTYALNAKAEYDVSTSKNGVQTATPKNGAIFTPKNEVAPTPKNGESNRKKETTKKTKTTTMAQAASAAAGDAAGAAGGGAKGDCSWRTESYVYLMAIHHTYPTNFTQPNGRNARKFADVPLAVVKAFTEECASKGLGTGLLLHKLQDYLDNPPPADAAPADQFAGWGAAIAPAEEETYTFDRPGYFPADLWGTLDGDQQAVFAAVVPAAGDWDYADPARPWPDALWLVRGRYRDIAAQVAAGGGVR